MCDLSLAKCVVPPGNLILKEQHKDIQRQYKNLQQQRQSSAVWPRMISGQGAGGSGDEVGMTVCLTPQCFPTGMDEDGILAVFLDVWPVQNPAPFPTEFYMLPGNSVSTPMASQQVPFLLSYPDRGTIFSRFCVWYLGMLGPCKPQWG